MTTHPDLDYTLIHQARKLITAANVHIIKTWILCYETSHAGSKRREMYENALREFVQDRDHIRAIRQSAIAACQHAEQVRKKSYDLDHEINDRITRCWDNYPRTMEPQPDEAED